MASEKLLKFIREGGISAEAIEFSGSVHTVADAAKEAGVGEEDLIKTVVGLAGDAPFVAVLPGNRKLDFTKMRALLGTGKVSIARPERVLSITGYPVGGVPPVFEGAEGIGFFFIDRAVLSREFVLGGGGDSKSLLKISPAEILRITKGTLAEISV